MVSVEPCLDSSIGGFGIGYENILEPLRARRSTKFWGLCVPRETSSIADSASFRSGQANEAPVTTRVR
jgi:hypothetical protein